MYKAASTNHTLSYTDVEPHDWFFPSKVGGKPAWLDLKNIPSKKNLECDYCHDPCIFLCQVYAPYEEDDNAFHRTIYVFICRNPDCCKSNENGNLKVLRSQLSRVNQYFPAEPPIEEENWRSDIGADKWVQTCQVCGISAPNHCSKCKNTNYCCRAHQVYDWKHCHKKSCGTNVLEKSTLLFPEYELVIEPEVLEEKDESVEAFEEHEMQKYRQLESKGEAGSLQHEDVQDELLSIANTKDDETFLQFRSRIDEYPDQVLRYEKGGEILYISSANKIEHIPRCLHCNSERQYEFQIMPQLLNFLDLKDNIKSIDWGILCIFTCKKSCTSEAEYLPEYAWKQDISSEETSTSSNKHENA
ncbi:hypothetical protein KM043_014028 [Ampulex compressa]|nr:hypothetical protein KM043_014028 [Ampulex compressa]